MIEIRRYKDTDFEALVLFLKKNWAKNHVLYKKELFDWQYKTAEGPASLIAHNNGKIVGFLGDIPGKYYVNGEVCSGVGLTMWVVAPEYLSSGLGVLLFRETEKEYPVLITLGSKREVVPLYEKLGFSHLPALRRFVIPLEVEGYMSLLAEPADAQSISIWVNRIFSESPPFREPEKNVIPDSLEKLYEKDVRNAFSFSLLRDAEFWRWRYLENKGFQYLFFGAPEQEGIITARVETVMGENINQTAPPKVLRIIELIPAGERFLPLLAGVLGWAREQGCVAADFQTSTLRLAPLLERAGFRLQDENYTPAECSLAGRFQPLQLRAKPINFLWRIRDEKGSLIRIAADDAYFVKSDCDMDRPNI